MAFSNVIQLLTRVTCYFIPVSIGMSVTKTATDSVFHYMFKDRKV